MCNKSNGYWYLIGLTLLYKIIDMIKLLTVPEFKAQIKNNDVQLLDVRTEMEYALGKIDGSTLINVQSSDFMDQAKKYINFQKPIYIYCRSGARSHMAAKILENMGAKEIFDLQGGFLSWSQNNK